jgi:hypothetical protein
MMVLPSPSSTQKIHTTTLTPLMKSTQINRKNSLPVQEGHSKLERPDICDIADAPNHKQTNKPGLKASSINIFLVRL